MKILLLAFTATAAWLLWKQLQTRRKPVTCPECGSCKVGRQGNRSYRRPKHTDDAAADNPEVLVNLFKYTCNHCKERWIGEEVVGEF